MASSNELPIEALERVDAACCAFEKALKQSEACKLDEYVRDVDGPERAVLLQELIAIDLDYRRRRGETVLLADYTALFPGDSEAIELAFFAAKRESPTDRGTTTQLDQVIADYIGNAVQQRELLKHHPDLPDELREFFRHRTRMETLINPLKSASSRQLSIRCPHCRTTVDLGDDALLSDMNCPSCGSSFSLIEPGSSVPKDLERIGQFQLVEQVGVGQFGAVWKAKDLALERIVAIKIPRSRQMSSSDVEVFLRDARVAAQLNHPNIASVHEVGKHDDIIYIVIDLIQGMSLDEWPKKRQLSFRAVVELCAKIALAVHYAHEQGVVHRDIKPGNIMMDLAGDPHIVDFGLAKREVGGLTMTMEGQILGTPAYMSPEQARGESHEANRSADIYSIGVVLFELLTGELPFRGNRQMMLSQILTDTPPSPRKFNSRVPRDLETVCLQCLEKQPTNRYETAAALAKDCQRFLDGEPVSARPISTFVHACRWCQRKPYIAGLSAAVIGLLLSVAYVYLTGYYQTQAALDVANDRANTIEQNLYSSEMFRAGLAAEKPEGLGEVNRLVNKWKPDEGEVDRRGWEWRYLFSLMHQDIGTFRHHDDVGPVTLAWSNDGTRLASAGERGVIQVWSNETKVLHEFMAHADTPGDPDFLTHVAWSLSDSNLASYSREGDIEIWDAKSGAHLQTLSHAGPIAHVEWTTDAELVSVFVSRDASGGQESITRVVWNVDTGESIKEMKWVTKDSRRFRWHPNGKLLATAREAGPISILNVETRQPKLQTGSDALATEAIEWNADGKRLAYSDGYGKVVEIFNTETGTRQRLPSTGSTKHVTWHPTKSLIAFADGNKEVHIRSVSATSTADQISLPGKTLRGHLERITSVSFHPTAPLVATAAVDGEIKIWQLNDRDEYADGSHVIAWHPAEHKYATCQQTNILIRDANDGTEQLINLGDHVDRIMDIGWSPDGKLLATLGHNQVVVLTEVATRSSRRVFDVQLPIRSFRFPKLVAWHPNGRLLAVPEDEQTIRIYDIVAGETKHLLRSDCKKLVCFEWDPSGAILAAGSEDCVLRLWDTESGVLAKKFGGPMKNEFIVTVDWNPDGSKIVCASSNYGVLVWDLSEQSSDWTRFGGHNSYVHTVSWSPDGERIVSTEDSGAIRVLDARTGAETLTLAHAERFIPDIAWSFDGSAIAAVDVHGNGVRVWDTRPRLKTAQKW